jgi:hypothetical protein
LSVAKTLSILTSVGLMMTAEIKNNLPDDDIIWVDQTVTNSLSLSDDE